MVSAGGQCNIRVYQKLQTVELCFTDQKLTNKGSMTKSKGKRSSSSLLPTSWIRELKSNDVSSRCDAPRSFSTADNTQHICPIDIVRVTTCETRELASTKGGIIKHQLDQFTTQPEIPALAGTLSVANIGSSGEPLCTLGKPAIGH